MGGWCVVKETEGKGGWCGCGGLLGRGEERRGRRQLFVMFAKFDRHMKSLFWICIAGYIDSGFLYCHV